MANSIVPLSHFVRAGDNYYTRHVRDVGCNKMYVQYYAKTRFQVSLHLALIVMAWEDYARKKVAVGTYHPKISFTVGQYLKQKKSEGGVNINLAISRV